MNQPNIVWLVGDHFAFKPYVDLYPQLQLATYARLGAEGGLFDQAYSVCPLCQPARSSMLTGTYPHRHGVLINDEQSSGTAGFAPDQKVISHFLAAAGYRCASFGKWHCGGTTTAHDYGFEGWSVSRYGSPYQSAEYADYLRERKLARPAVELEWAFGSLANCAQPFVLGSEAGAGFGPWLAAGRFTGSIETHEAVFTANLACRWLHENAQQADPFFMRVDVWGPHHPYHGPGELLNRVDPASLDPYPGFGQFPENMPRNYEVCRKKWRRDQTHLWSWWQTGLARCLEQIMLVDHALGRVVDALDALGLRENTLVIYTADHGDLIASHGGLINKDSLMFEETMRVPLALRWPARFPGSGCSSALVSNMDLMATTLEAAGALPAAAGLDSVSLLPLAEQPTAPGREVLVCESHGEAAVEFVQRMIRWKHYKYIAHLDDRDLLYDLKQDPFEQHNLAAVPESQAVLRQMRLLLLAEMAEHADSGVEAERLRQQLA